MMVSNLENPLNNWNSEQNVDHVSILKLIKNNKIFTENLKMLVANEYNGYGTTTYESNVKRGRTSEYI